MATNGGCRCFEAIRDAFRGRPDAGLLRDALVKLRRVIHKYRQALQELDQLDPADTVESAKSERERVLAYIDTVKGRLQQDGQAHTTLELLANDLRRREHWPK